MNQLSYKVSKKKFESLGCKLKYQISNDIYKTLKIFINITSTIIYNIYTNIKKKTNHDLYS